jgi:hypothetical protein
VSTSSPSNKPEPARYKTTNWKQYNAALKRRGSLLVWIDPTTQWYANSPSGRAGRDRIFSDAAIQCCLTLKCLFQLPLRQTIGLVEGLLKLAKLDWRVPDYSTLSRRQANLEVTLVHRPCARLDLLIDSTGLKAFGEGEWKKKKHGSECASRWLKVHLAMDANTQEIRAVVVTDNTVGDQTAMPVLLEQIEPEQEVGSATLDGIYDTQTCHDALAERGFEAVIPARKRARLCKEKTPGLKRRNEIVQQTHELGRAGWKKASGYHRRSLVETQMHRLKLLGERVMARTFERQVREVQVRVAVLNRFTHLGMPETVRVA